MCKIYSIQLEFSLGKEGKGFCCSAVLRAAGNCGA